MSNGITSLGEFGLSQVVNLQKHRITNYTYNFWGKEVFSDCPKLTAISIPEGTTTIRMDFGYTPLGTITVGGVELTIPEGSTATRIYITIQQENCDEFTE